MKNSSVLFLLMIGALSFCAVPCMAQDASPTPKPSSAAGPADLFNMDSNKEPTYIKSDSLTLRSKDRVFVYTGNVEVKQGDMILTSNELEGKYSEDNQISSLVATKNVVILKGEGIRATSERATYEKATDTLVLTESPELTQDGSILTADAIKMYLKDNRSEAEGAVRVKVIEDKEKKEGGGGGKHAGGRKKKG